MFYFYRVYPFFILFLQVKCEDKVLESKNPLPYFRRQVEEIAEDTTASSSLSFDTRSNLVSFLINNVKKIFNELEDIEQIETTTPLNAKAVTRKVVAPERTVELSHETNIVSTKKNTIDQGFKPTRLRNLSKKPSYKLNLTSPTVYFDEVTTKYTNGTLVTVTDEDFIDMESTPTNELTEKEELMHLSKNLIFFETDRRQRDNNYYVHNASYYSSGSDASMRSCIFCNNVFLEDCNDPRNRLIPSTVCEREDDVCYSQHTPFGVIDRGCYNVNHNLTTYVCSCNLCNYISISELPYVFLSKQDWVDNVIELSRSRHLRKSVFKDMSCLKCESNATAKTGDMLDTANCLEGNIGSLPTEECEENEICAVKAIKHDGYLWRGCTKEPLYNYWWAYCDSDLCNYDIVSSIYEIE